MFKRLLLPFFISLFFLSFSAKAQTSEEKASGYVNITELNYSQGIIHKNRDHSIGLQTINGYKFNHHVSAGLGVGIEKYFYKNGYEGSASKGPIYLPVFSDIRIFLGKGDIQPFFGQSFGYTFCVYQPGYYRQSGINNNIGGIMINPFIGIKIALTEKTDLNLSLGYRFQELTFKNLALYGNYDTQDIFVDQWITTSHFLTLKTGFTF